MHADKQYKLFVNSENANELWLAIQDMQVEFTFAQELGVFNSLKSWRDAKSVLDVGCGTGYHLRKLAEWFPDKNCTGVDLSEEFIDHAIKYNCPAELNLEFKVGDANETEGKFDFVLMRLLLQHVDDVPGLLRHNAQIINPGGHLLVIDACDEARLYVPEAPHFLAFFHAYKNQQKTLGRSRDAVLDLIQNPQLGGLTTVEHRKEIVPSTIPGNFDLLWQTYDFFIKLVEETGSLPGYDFSKAKQEWSEWKDHKTSYTQVGLNYLLLRRD